MKTLRKVIGLSMVFLLTFHCQKEKKDNTALMTGVVLLANQSASICIYGTACTALNLTGVVTTLAGSGTAASTDGTGTAASFNGPNGITTDGTNLYVSEFTGNKIRQIK